ncbi:MAG: HU family DNA-binding protein [Candidatus Sumerlaeota bacterium]|nr:HU family DNA-binding protein [Candidatus Sumerlaeota bacterium]
MNRSELAKKVAESCELSDAAGHRAVDAVFDIIQQELAKGEKVAISKFGTFAVRSRAARMGRNPRTGEQVQVPASKKISFKAAATLKEALLSPPASPTATATE